MSTKTELFTDIACRRCSCTCDDLRITVAEGRVIQADGACHLAEQWLTICSNQDSSPATIEGRQVEWPKALEKAASLLSASRSPLIYGLSGCGPAEVRAASALADRLRGTLDIVGSQSQQPTLLALQEVGKSTCTLGEARQRADLVIYWGVDPEETHPRLLERIAGGPADRRIAVVDVQPNSTGKQADLTIQLDPSEQLETLWTLAALVAEKPLVQDFRPAPADKQLRQLAKWMTECRVGVVFVGERLTEGKFGHRLAEAMFRLIRQLNDRVRFHAIGTGTSGEAAGADSVLTWTTGFPFATNFHRGYPRYSPGEYTAAKLLEREEADACLLVGDQPWRQLSPGTLERLSQIPTILIDSSEAETGFTPSVRVSVGSAGVHLASTAHRMDDISIPARPFLASNRPSATEALNRLLKLIQVEFSATAQSG